MKRSLSGLEPTELIDNDRKIWGLKCCNYSVKEGYLQQRIDSYVFQRNAIWNIIWRSDGIQKL